MPRTNLSSRPGSTAASSAPDLPSPGGVCAIHQPNLFPRLSTLAKLFAADYWIILDDVQFTRRDYQHRARLAALDDPRRQRWLSIPTSLPFGRQTAISDALLTEPARSRRRTEQMLQQHYRSSPHWPAFRRELSVILDLFDATDKTAEIAESSTCLLLGLLGWEGQVLRSSRLTARRGRSQRLADLAAVTGARTYLCGTGGLKYLEIGLFTARGIDVIPFRTPMTGLWEAGREVSAIRSLMTCGPRSVANELRAIAAV
jgi:hypothetical protein